MYYTAQAEIQVGKVKIDGVTDVVIEKSVDAIGGTARISASHVYGHTTSRGSASITYSVKFDDDLVLDGCRLNAVER